MEIAKNVRLFFAISIIILYLVLTSNIYALDIPIDDFSISEYTQNINDYLSKTREDYSQPLLSKEYQSLQLKEFYKHYYSSNGLSPWSATMIMSILPIVTNLETEIISQFKFTNNHQHYAENFKIHTNLWLNKIIQNVNLHTLNNNYLAENRAIAINNTFARSLPDIAPDFFHISLPGQGFPFDNLQEAVIYAGTPLYVLHTTEDYAWSLVLTPEAYFTWIKSNDLAYVTKTFIKNWQIAAKKSMVAITKTDTTVMNQYHNYQFNTYIGAVFPLSESSINTINSQQISILIPIKTQYNQARIVVGLLNKNAAQIMPLTASKKNLVKIFKQLQNRPYGWGGAFFFNDCSEELKNLFTPFGIWLPRNSIQQAQLDNNLDLSDFNLDTRIANLLQKGHPLMTIIYVGGHVMLYVGKQIINNELVAITYQNIWGLSPADKHKRYIIGQSLFLPLLKYYPQNPDIMSLAARHDFKLIYLDELNNYTSTKDFVKLFNIKHNNTII